MNQSSTLVEELAVVYLLFKVSTKDPKKLSNLTVVGTDAYIVVLKLFEKRERERERERG